MIIVDNRETKKRKYKAEKVFKEIKIEQLDSGDYVYDNIAIELKTADDYINSIKNKRLFKQVIKMAETYDYHYVIIYGNMQTAINKTRYHGKYFSVNQFIGSLSSLAQITTILQVNNESQAFKLMNSLFKKSKDKKERFIITPEKKVKNKLVGILMYLGGINSSKAIMIVETFNLTSLEDMLKLTKSDLESIEGIGPKTSKNIVRWLK